MHRASWKESIKSLTLRQQLVSYQDMQALICKIVKSIVAPLPTKYSAAFRGLVKSMLRKNPELRPSATELLRHPHLQPYVLKIHMKLNNPRRNSLPLHCPKSDYVSKARFLEPEDIPRHQNRAKRQSYNNDRTLNPSISEADQDSLSSTQRIQNTPSHASRRLAEFSFGSTHDKAAISKPVTSKNANTCRTPGLTPTKASATPRRWTEPRKNALLTPDKTPLPRSRRVSLPMPARAALQQCLYTRNINSPDVSVNAPRFDRIAEFPLASYEECFFNIRRASPVSAQGSTSSPGDRFVTKDKCTRVQVSDTALERRNSRESGSACSDQNATAGASSRASSDSRRHQFNTSSFQQRAEALEGLLEFSAKLLQQDRFEELGVLLNPFGPVKVSPRETAIWLSKSLKENTVKLEDQRQN